MAGAGVASPKHTHTNMFASSAVPSPSNRAIGDVLAELLSVKESISKAGREIDEVGRQMETIKEKLETQLSPEDKTFLCGREKQLGAEEILLLQEQNLLLKKMALLGAERNRLLYPPVLSQHTIPPVQRSMPRTREKVNFKFSMCQRFPDRVQFISEDSSNYLIRCMVTDCWLPQRECIPCRLVSPTYRNLMRKAVFIGLDGCIVDQNGVLWAQGIDTAFSRYEVCLMYNPLERKLIFFVLNSQLLDQVICHSPNRAITFRAVDGKTLEFGGLPSLRLESMLLHAKNAISDTREKIRISERKAPPNWDTLETLNSMMQDAALRSNQDSYSSEELGFAQFAALPVPDENASSSLAEACQPDEPNKVLSPYPSPGDEIFTAPPLPRSASSFSQSVNSESKSKLDEFRVRITELQNKSKADKAASSQLVIVSRNSADVAPFTFQAHASVSNSTSSFFQNPHSGPAQSLAVRPSTARPGTTDPASAHVPHRPSYADVVSRGGYLNSTVSSIMRSVPPRRLSARAVTSRQQPQENKKGKKPFQK